jgi:very-short-patch-repair endonuclease
VRRNGRWRASSEVQQAARVLRSATTPSEKALWKELRGNALEGLRFRRQHAVDRFVLDFYCSTRTLAVEVDGPVHDAQRERDGERTAALALRGIRVIRFTNDEVLSDVCEVVERIRWWAGFAPGEEPEE